GGVSSWSTAELLPHLAEVDAVYVNFISGFELEIEAAETVRELGIPTYADLHSLFLGPPGEGVRPPRQPPELMRWLAAFDAVQMNESELRLTGDPGAAAEALVVQLARSGPPLLLVTCG